MYKYTSYKRGIQIINGKEEEEVNNWIYNYRGMEMCCSLLSDPNLRCNSFLRSMGPRMTYSWTEYHSHKSSCTLTSRPRP